MADLNCTQTFIAASEDCPMAGETPSRKGEKPSIAEVHFDMLVAQPYRYTQAEVLFASSSGMRYAGDLTAEQEAQLRDEFFSRPQACLRTSPLVKRYGWGIHFDENGRGAAYPKGSEEYTRLLVDPSLTHTKGMRSKRT